MKIKVLIADDEPLAREIIFSYLKDFNINSVIEVTNGKEAVEQINSTQPDLVFMDIEMPILDGISVFDSEKLNHFPVVVFTTAYNQFAIKAFELNAVDYLLKPFDRERFHAAVNKSLEKLKLKEFKNFHDQWNKINSDLLMAQSESNEHQYLSKLVVRDSKRIRHIDTASVYYIQASGDYIEIVDNQNKFLIYKAISDIQKKLDPSVFRRVHKSYIINCNHILEIRPLTNSEYQFHLSNGMIIKSGRTYKTEIEDLVKGNI